MILGISCGRCDSKVEFGAGSSDFWIASAEASSIRSDKSVETVCSKNVTSTRVIRINISRGRRMVRVVYFYRPCEDRGEVCRGSLSLMRQVVWLQVVTTPFFWCSSSLSSCPSLSLSLSHSPLGSSRFG